MHLLMGNVFVIVVTYNGSVWVDRCFGSLTKSTIPLTVIAIDNCSTDDTVNRIRDYFPNVEVICNDSNLGFGKANNIGLRRALNDGADYVFLLNQDAWIQVDTVERLIETFKLNPSYGIVSPVHLNGKADDVDSGFAKCIKHNNIAKIKLGLSNGQSCEEVTFVNAAAWLMSRDCIEKVGGFDPLFSHYGEDRDYCNRLQFYGWALSVNLNTTICHDRKYSDGNAFRKMNNMLYSSGLAHFKDINHPLIINVFSWVVGRLPKLGKYLFLLKFKSAVNEFHAFSSLLMNLNSIHHHRRLSLEMHRPFI